MKDIICWWSGGVTSAVACKLAIDIFGKDRCRVVMQDTKNEHPDTYRFKADCEKWYCVEIETITGLGKEFKTIKDVWIKYLSLNTATGAICSTELKRLVREDFQKRVRYEYQVFGYEFEANEFKRSKSMSLNHPSARSIFPLLMFGYDKKKCVEIIQFAGIDVPLPYFLGYKNNNCWQTGCVQGGIGYWQKIEIEEPLKFDDMADLEHYLTDLKGEPVTMLKDQSKVGKGKEGKGNLVFLKKHPKYHDNKCLADMPKCKVEPLFECNGFCGTNDLSKRSKTEKEINYGTSI